MAALIEFQIVVARQVIHPEVPGLCLLFTEHNRLRWLGDGADGHWTCWRRAWLRGKVIGPPIHDVAPRRRVSVRQSEAQRIWSVRRAYENVRGAIVVEQFRRPCWR